MNWLIELIPDADVLFYRVNIIFIRDGELKPKVFQERGEGAEKGMSTNWAKYSTAQQLKETAKKPEENGIIRFIAGELRAIKLNVIHDPLEENQSHTNVNGLPDNLNDVELRLKMLDLLTWEILPTVPLNPTIK